MGELNGPGEVHPAAWLLGEQPLEQDLRELEQHLCLGRHPRQHLGEEAVEAHEPLERVAQLALLVDLECERAVVGALGGGAEDRVALALIDLDERCPLLAEAIELRVVDGVTTGAKSSTLPPTFSAMPKKYREVRAALEEAGWTVLRQRGSHEVWGKGGEHARIVVAGKNSETIPVGTLSSIRRASGLEHLR